MILVSDSGSTKADWIAGDAGKVSGEFNTKGFNPFFHDEKLELPFGKLHDIFFNFQKRLS